MTEPDFLLLDEVLEIHRDQISRYGGALGVGDGGLLQSAIAQPRAMFSGQYLHADLFEMAAAYLFHLVQNHPFIDGNKRVGAVAAIVFLEMNGVEISAAEDEYERLVLQVVQGTARKQEIAAFFRARGIAGRVSPLPSAHVPASNAAKRGELATPRSRNSASAWVMSWSSPRSSPNRRRAAAA